MRRITRPLVLAFAIAATAAGTAITANGAPPQATTLTLTGKQVAPSFHYGDQAPRGESSGDTISFSEALYMSGTRVGFSEVTGTLADHKRHDATNLTGTLILHNGTITLQGTSLGQTPTQHVAIVGGTGAYTGAHGEDTITTGPTSTTHVLTYTQ
jgi:hypothetical protein